MSNEQNPNDDDARFRKRYRTVFTTKQRIRLEREFRKAKYLSKTKKTKLSKELNLRRLVVQDWFQNRRMKEKRLLITKITKIQQRQDSDSFVHGVSLVPHSDPNVYHAKHFDNGQNKAILSHISVEGSHVGTYSNGNCVSSSYQTEQNPLKSLNNRSDISHYVQGLSYPVEPVNQIPSHDVNLGRFCQAETSDGRRSPSSGINSNGEGSVNLNCGKAGVSMNNYSSKVSGTLSITSIYSVPLYITSIYSVPLSDWIIQTEISKDQSSSQEKNSETK